MWYNIDRDSYYNYKLYEDDHEIVLENELGDYLRIPRHRFPEVLKIIAEELEKHV